MRFEIDKAPQKIKQQFNFIKLLCFLNDPQNKKLSFKELGKKFNMNDSTVGRFLRKEFENHKKIHKFVKESNICEIKNENKQFEIFMLDFVLPQLSLHTIKKNKFFNDYYKLGVQLGKFKYQSIYTKNPERDLKKIKKELKEINSKNKKNNENKENNSKKTKKIYKPLKKINILATTKSSETLKQLAKDFNCEIKEIDNRFDKHTELVFNTNPGKYYY